MAATENVFKKAVSLKPSEKAQLIDKLISALDRSDKEIDELWAKEAETRIDAIEYYNYELPGLGNTTKDGDALNILTCFLSCCIYIKNMERGLL